MIKTAPLALLALLAGLPAAGRSETVPLADWPADASPRVVGRRLAERFLVTPHMLYNGATIHYAEVCTWIGALRLARRSGDDALRARLADRFEPFFGNEAHLVPAIDHVDNSVFGALPLELYVQKGHARHRALGLAIADGQWDNPDSAGLTRQVRYWIDDMYMITMLQVQAYRATGERRHLDRAAQAMAAYLDRLQQPNGLFFHAPDAPFHWGRGNGWMAAGTSELLRELPEDHPLRPRILAGYRRMMATLLRHQSESGLWRQLIDGPDSWPETSSSAMFAFAFVTGVKRGWLDAAAFAPAARRAWLALVGQIDEQGAVREVCVGTGTRNDRQYYLDRPRVAGDLHGQAPVLWLAAALLEQ